MEILAFEASISDDVSEGNELATHRTSITRTFISGSLGLFAHVMVSMDRHWPMLWPMSTKYKSLENKAMYKVYVDYLMSDIGLVEGCNILVIFAGGPDG